MRAERPSYGVASSSTEWAWCLDLHQRFAGLLDVAGMLVELQQRPGEESEMGSRALNLYLVVCALAQVLSHYRHRRLYDLSRLRLRGWPSWLLRAASRTQQAIRRRTAGRRLRRHERQLQVLALLLAEAVLSGKRIPSAEATKAVARIRRARWPRALLLTRLRVPEGFRGGDLYPADCALLARLAANACGWPAAPVVVIGHRTAGVAMAPLCAAALAGQGHPDVRLMSIRPGVPLLADEARQVRTLTGSGAWFLLVDSSDTNGTAFAMAVSCLTGLGVPAARICLAGRQIAAPSDSDIGGTGHGAVAPFEARDAAGALAMVQRVTIPAGDGVVDALLTNEAVSRWLNRPLILERLHADGATVLGSEELGAHRKLVSLPTSPTPRPSRVRQGHAMKLFKIELVRADERWQEMILARGVGLGFFGYHSWLVATCLGDRTPAVLGIHDGLMFMRWEPGAGAPESVFPEELDEIAAYVAVRARRLDLTTFRRSVPTPKIDPSGLGGVAAMLARPLGRGSVLAEPAIADLLDRRLRPRRRSVVDGRMGLEEWVRTGDGRLLKLDFEEHGFEADGARVVDAAQDLAGAVVGFRLESDEEQRLLDAYVRFADDSDGLDARVVAYTLQNALRELELAAAGAVDLHSAPARTAFARELAIREALPTRAVNSYLARRLLDGASRLPAEGALWMLRLEGVLETDRLGFPSASPAGALALRALLRHGHQVTLATGRSLGELRERCHTFGLLGGVAEHGSVVWARGLNRPLPIASSGARHELARMREVLLEKTDAIVDGRYQHCVVVFRYGPDGRRAVDGAEVRALLHRHRARGLEVVEGRRSTVIRAAGCGESAAFERLRPLLPSTNRPMPVSVVGAAGGDLGLLRLAAARHATSAASPQLKDAGKELHLQITRRTYQSGMLAIARTALHGRRGRCPGCAPPALDGADSTLIRLLGLQDRGRLGRLAFLARYASLRGCEL